MNREGTMLAVLPSDPAAPGAATEAFQRILLRHKLETTQLSGKPYHKAARSFSESGAWLRSADVDRLSEQEAEIVAARLVRRTNAKTPLPKEKADALRRELASIARRSFIKQDITFDEAQKLGMEAARRLLDESQLRAFNEATEAGLRALPGER